ncbi:hypothetical protein D3C85_1348860 [compost metagenome]
MRRGQAFAEAVDFVRQPFLNRQQIAFSNQAVELRKLFAERIQNLCRIHIPQRVGSKITEVAPGPVNILQYAQRIGRRSDAQVLLILGIPDLRQILNLQPFIENKLFDFITDNDMQVIRQLVSFNPDK